MLILKHTLSEIAMVPTGKERQARGMDNCGQVSPPLSRPLSPTPTPMSCPNETISVVGTYPEAGPDPNAIEAAAAGDSRDDDEGGTRAAWRMMAPFLLLVSLVLILLFRLLRGGSSAPNSVGQNSPTGYSWQSTGAGGVPVIGGGSALGAASTFDQVGGGKGGGREGEGGGGGISSATLHGEGKGPAKGEEEKPNGEGVSCGKHQSVYHVRDADSCWSIAQGHDLSVAGLRDINPGIKCESLWVGAGVCVPKNSGRPVA